jgi:hypothetical protein
VKQICLLAVLVGALAFLTLGLPASALAGTYSWNLASDLTSAAPGANPDHDQYGSTAWSYEESSSTGSHAPSTFSSLPSFATGVDGGLSAWSDSTSGALVGINPGSAPITSGNSSFPPGQIVMEPGGGGQLAVVGWTSPLSHTASVHVTGSVVADSTASGLLCSPSTSWRLDQNGAALVGGTTPTASPTSFNTPASVDPGGSIYLTISTSANAGCDAVGVTLQIQADASAPAVTLTKPAANAVSIVGDPAFSGAADTTFGDSNQVTLRIYAGHDTSGTPVQTLTTTQSGGAWSITPSSTLADGVYTAQAEQDNRASPSDAGLSAPVTFTVLVGPPVTIVSPGSKPLRTSKPILSGTAGARPGDNPNVFVFVFAGPNTNSKPIRKLTVPVTTKGTYSVKVTPALPDGVYTAGTIQGDSAGGIGFSAAVTFTIDAHPPSVTLVTPRSRSRADGVNLVFRGHAGTAVGDLGTVAVLVYKGSKAKGKPLARINVKTSGARWLARWGANASPGVYTARAAQHDGAGHTGLSAAHTFRIVPPPPLVAPVLTMNSAGRVRVKVACVEPPGDTCTGTILVLTQGNFQPKRGGPFGRLSIVFAHVNILGGHNHEISQVAPPLVVAALRGLATVPVTIIANLRPAAGKAIHATVRAELRHVG